MPSASFDSQSMSGELCKAFLKGRSLCHGEEIISYNHIKIRQFEESDFPAVNRILAGSFSGKIYPLTGLSGKDAEVLAESLRIFPGKQIGGYFVAEYDGEIAGAMLLKFTGQIRPKDNVSFWAVAEKYGVFRALKLLFGFYILVESIRPEECYIEFLATGSDLRGKGIATALIRHAWDYAKNYAKDGRTFEELTLYVAGNNSARGLYEKLGFRVQSSYKSRITKFIFGIDTWVYMTVAARKNGPNKIPKRISE